MRQPTWDDVRRFCAVEGWEPTHQLKVTEEEFWAAVDDGRAPDRGRL